MTLVFQASTLEELRKDFISLLEMQHEIETRLMNIEQTKSGKDIHNNRASLCSTLMQTVRDARIVPTVTML